MDEKKVTPAQKKARAVQIGDGINRSIIEKGQRLNTERLIQKMLDEAETKAKSKKETAKDEANE